MATRKRKPTDKKLPAFRSAGREKEQEENDLKKVKEQVAKELEEEAKKKEEWFDKEFDKNLKNIK